MVGSRACRGIGLERMRIIGGRQSWLRMPERLKSTSPYGTGKQGIGSRLGPPARIRTSSRSAECLIVDQTSILGLVDQRAFLDPRHHVAELDADLLDRVLRELGAGRLE